MFHGMPPESSAVYTIPSRKRKAAGINRRPVSAVEPFHAPTRLADGLGIGSSLSGESPEYAPVDRVPRIRPWGRISAACAVVILLLLLLSRILVNFVETLVFTGPSKLLHFAHNPKYGMEQYER